MASKTSSRPSLSRNNRRYARYAVGKIHRITTTAWIVVGNSEVLRMSEDGPSADIRPAYGWLITISAFLISGTIVNSQLQSGNFLSFLFVGGIVAMPFWVILTDSGAEWAMEAISESNNNIGGSSSTTSSEAKQICSDCGWQNPRTNNYCTDCGRELNE